MFSFGLQCAFSLSGHYLVGARYFNFNEVYLKIILSRIVSLVAHFKKPLPCPKLSRISSRHLIILLFTYSSMICSCSVWHWICPLKVKGHLSWQGQLDTDSCFTCCFSIRFSGVWKLLWISSVTWGFGGVCHLDGRCVVTVNEGAAEEKGQL